MILIEGLPLHCFEPRMCFHNTGLAFDERFSYLDRALIRSKAQRDGHNYRISEKLNLNNEYMKHPQNLLIIEDNKDGMKFFVILDSRVKLVTDNVEDDDIKKVFELDNFGVIDSYGKELEIKSYEDLITLVNNVKSVHEKFAFKLDSYHKHMENLFDLRRNKEKNLCCFISEHFDKLIELSDELGKELCDTLSAYHDSDEYNVIDKYIRKYSDEEKKIYIFGLYLCALRAYGLNYDSYSLSLDERIREGFTKELNFFVKMHPDIVDKYSNYFNLRKIEKANIKQLLYEEGLDGSEWLNAPAEIDIL